MDDEVGIKLEAGLSLVHSRLDQVDRRLRQWAAVLRRDLPAVAGVGVTGQPLIFDLGSPPSGYRWRVRAIQATGPSVTAVASVNMDIYVGGANNPAPGFAASPPVAQVPGVGNWWASSGTSATPGALPVAYFPSSRELETTDPVFVVLSGAGVVTGTLYYVSMTVDQFEGLSGLSN